MVDADSNLRIPACKSPLYHWATDEKFHTNKYPVIQLKTVSVCGVLRQHIRVFFYVMHLILSQYLNAMHAFSQTEQNGEFVL